MLSENLQVVKANMSFTKSKKKDLLTKSWGRCSHCGKELSAKDMLGIHDIISHNGGGTVGMSSLVAVCLECDDEVKGVAQPLEYYEYLSMGTKERVLLETKKYDEEANWYSNNDIYPKGNLVIGDVTLLNLTSSEYSEELLKFIENYNTGIGLSLYGEEGLVDKILKDGRFYALRDSEGAIELLIPIKPLKNPKGYILHVGNIMVKHGIEVDEVKLELYNKVVNSLLNVFKCNGEESMVLDVVLACNSKDGRVVPIVKNRLCSNYKVNTIRPGYSLAQSFLEIPNGSFMKEIEGKCKSGDFMNDKNPKVVELIKKSKKSFGKLVRLYIESSGGLDYETYINNRHRNKEG